MGSCSSKNELLPYSIQVCIFNLMNYNMNTLVDISRNYKINNLVSMIFCHCFSIKLVDAA